MDNSPEIFVEAYTLYDFLQAVVANAQKGYVITEDNDGFPHGTIGHYTTKMRLPSADKVEESVAEAVESPSLPQKRAKAASKASE